jgi:hypothetical protein
MIGSVVVLPKGLQEGYSKGREIFKSSIRTCLVWPGPRLGYIGRSWVYCKSRPSIRLGHLLGGDVTSEACGAAGGRSAAQPIPLRARAVRRPSGASLLSSHFVLITSPDHQKFGVQYTLRFAFRSA